MTGLTHEWLHDGRVTKFTWVGDADVAVARVYALAFDGAGKILLVGGGPDDSDWWLPGGGVEVGETVDAALARELSEEAGARIRANERLGVEHVTDPEWGENYHAFCWCRIELEEIFEPQHEVHRRQLVSPDAFLDQLFWGRSDPKAKTLLERSMKLDRAHSR